MHNRYLAFIIIFLCLCQTQLVFAFGKNKIKYKQFNWQFIQTEHFDIYFYEGGNELAGFTADVAENAYLQIKRDFKYEIETRIVFIVYNSHNDWQQTNVVSHSFSEATKGITELFKNRIVVKFEGDYEQFRHAVHHELVHGVMNDMLYKGLFTSVITAESYRPPIWFSEGLAEFQSEGWSTRKDMVIRDAVVNNYLPNLATLEYSLAYQGGASVFKYIAETYGREEIADLVYHLKKNIFFDRVLRAALGVNIREFTRGWHRYLHREYWPEIANRREPSDIARQLTDHSRRKTAFNVSPAISPDGSKVAFIAEHNGYRNVYLMDALSGQILKTLIKGAKSDSFEELHFLRPGMSFSPDGSQLVFSAKSGAHDAIFMINIETGDLKKFEPALDGIYTAACSPDGERIAFIGNKNGRSGIYLLYIADGRVEGLTDDYFSDDELSWSADGKKLAFTSNRNYYLTPEHTPADIPLSELVTGAKDIYILDLESRNVERITDTPWEEGSPIFSPDGNTLAYVSDENGISNLILQNLDSGEYYSVTDVISGIYQINWDRRAKRMVFTTYYQGGYDIYMLHKPLDRAPVPLRKTVFAEMRFQDKRPPFARDWDPERDKVNKLLSPNNRPKIRRLRDLSEHVFVVGNRSAVERVKRQNARLAQSQYREEDGSYKVQKYRPKFTPDVLDLNPRYDILLGAAVNATFAHSDLLGDHKFLLNVDIVNELKNSGLGIFYQNSRNRFNYGFGARQRTLFFDNEGVKNQRYRTYGLSFSLEYPFSKSNRLELNLDWNDITLKHLTLTRNDQRLSTLLPRLSYVHDSIQKNRIGPIDGRRYIISFKAANSFSGEGYNFRTLALDYRRYYMVNSDYNFAFRVSGAASFGEAPQRFFVGGIDNWVNPDFRGSRRTDNIRDVYFSEYATPLRGAAFYETEGSRYLLSNLEFRFPLIRFLGLGFPPLRVFNVRGVFFYDVGTAFDAGESWYKNANWRGTTRNANGEREFRDIISGYGFGARINILYFLLRADVAWRYNLTSTSKPVWYLSLGANL